MGALGPVCEGELTLWAAKNGVHATCTPFAPRDVTPPLAPARRREVSSVSADLEIISSECQAAPQGWCSSKGCRTGREGQADVGMDRRSCVLTKDRHPASLPEPNHSAPGQLQDDGALRPDQGKLAGGSSSAGLLLRLARVSGIEAARITGTRMAHGSAG